jgi:hypothetical protein
VTTGQRPDKGFYVNLMGIVKLCSKFFPVFDLKIVAHLPFQCGREFRPRGIRVFAVHPGHLKTAAAPPDADTLPEIAAERLADWIEKIDQNAPCALSDRLSGTVLPW